MAACFSCPVACRTNQLRGRNVSSAVSLVSSMEPNIVTITSAVQTLRTVRNVRTIRCDSAANTCISRSAPTTASTLKRHTSVLIS